MFLVSVSGLADAGLGVAMIRSRGRHHTDTGSGTMLSTLAIACVSTVHCHSQDVHSVHRAGVHCHYLGVRGVGAALLLVTLAGQLFVVGPID